MIFVLGILENGAEIRVQMFVYILDEVLVLELLEVHVVLLLEPLLHPLKPLAASSILGVLLLQLLVKKALHVELLLLVEAAPLAGNDLGLKLDCVLFALLQELDTPQLGIFHLET